MFAVWVWRSLVARLNGVQEAGGSNPLTQTNVAARRILKESRTKYRLSFFCRLRLLFPKNLTSQKLIQIFGSPDICKAYLKRKSDKVPTFFNKRHLFFGVFLIYQNSTFFVLFPRGPRKTVRFLGCFYRLRLLFPKNLTSQSSYRFSGALIFARRFRKNFNDKRLTFSFFASKLIDN